MYIKKIIASVALVATVAVSAAMFAAFEAHVINVTAHIENALSVHDDIIPFGTVFPQEYTTRQFTVELSSSFQEQGRIDDVTYVIKQKPKCECIYDEENNPEEYELYCTEGRYAAVDYATHECPEYVDESGNVSHPYVPMLDLCRFLSKTNDDPDGIDPYSGQKMPENDVSHPSYFVDPDNDPGNPNGNESCVDPGADAEGKLMQSTGDVSDSWVIDLKVPPVAGYVGQDWPASCAEYVVPEDSKDYGCDLWIEVTGFSPFPGPILH